MQAPATQTPCPEQLGSGQSTTKGKKRVNVKTLFFMTSQAMFFSAFLFTLIFFINESKYELHIYILGLKHTPIILEASLQKLLFITDTRYRYVILAPLYPIKTKHF